jgi:hypothetical protein
VSEIVSRIRDGQVVGSYSGISEVATRVAIEDLEMAILALLRVNDTATVPFPDVRPFGVSIDGGGVAIAANSIAYLPCPHTGTITSWTIVADQSGSIVVDVWKDTYANFPPTVADTIAASAKPTLASQQKNSNTGLVGWTTAVTAGDVFGFKVDSATTVQRVTVVLTMELAT